MFQFPGDSSGVVLLSANQRELRSTNCYKITIPKEKLQISKFKSYFSKTEILGHMEVPD